MAELQLHAEEDTGPGAELWSLLQGVEFKQTYYDAGGIRTRALEAGQGEALIFLHGTGGHAEAYVKNIAEHAKHFRVLSIDMVGHGYSDTPDIDYGMQHYVDHLIAFMDAAGIEKAHFSGESMGGSIAAWLAQQHPDRVLKICLNTGIPLAPAEGKPADQIRGLLERTRKATGGAITRDDIRGRLAWLFANPERDISDSLVEARYSVYTQPGRAPVLRKITEMSLGTLLDPAARETWYNPEALRDIKCPVLMLWTDHNPGQPAELAKEGAALIPDCEFVLIEDAAHWPQWEKPDEFNRVHIEFLKK